MTLLPPSLFIARMVVYSRGQCVYDESFHSGVNIIRGANGSGKSTIAEFLFFVLGGDVSKWKREAEMCDEVLAEILINGSPITVKRRITTLRRQALAIYWGPLDKALKTAVEGWQEFPFQRSSGKESFSQVLFRALGLPDVKSEMGSNLTMHQILRLVYTDQLTSTEELMRSEENFDLPLVRDAVGHLLLGVYDDDLCSNELKLREMEKDLGDVKRQFDGVNKVLGDTGQEVDFAKLKAAIASANVRLEQVRAFLKDTGQVDKIPVDNLTQVMTLHKGAVELRQELASVQQQFDRQTFEIEDSKAFIASLENRINSLDDALTTRSVLGELTLKTCPKCLTPLDAPVLQNICVLCKHPVGVNGKDAMALRMKQELALQLKESKEILQKKQEKFVLLAGRLPDLQSRTQLAQEQFDDATNKVKLQREAKIDDLYVEKGRLENHIEHLSRQLTAATILEDLRNKKKGLSSEIQEVSDKIKVGEERQRRSSMKAFEVITKYVLEFLRKDLPREEVFRTGQAVEVNFAKNSFSIDGRNQFSASSLTYLKNSIHFALFFASLELGFFRYPRLIICDNIEDKGMEEARSHNFQMLIAEISGRFKEDHQIIFTTSMIEPHLDKNPPCVGEKYDQTHKSLRMPSNN